MKDYYRILGLKETATADEIHGRWIELMQKFHPDHGIQGETDDEKAKEINEAYQVLKHSSSRMEYDLEKLHQRKLKKISIQKVVFPVLSLIFIFILILVFMKKPQISTPLKSKPGLSSSSQAELSPIPHYEPGPYIDDKLHIAEAENGVKVEKEEKVVLQKKGQEKATASEIPKKKAEPPLKMAHSGVSVKLARSSIPKESNPVSSADNPGLMKLPEALEKVSAVHHVSVPSPSVKVQDQVAELKPPSLIATDREVKHFFADYIEQYAQKDSGGFISLFSSKAIQNQKDGLEGIRRIYDNFFNQSEELRYRLEDTRIEIYQNAVEIKARYEIDQILKREGEKKIWRGHAQWVLVKEEGVLKITSLNYQHDLSP
jgi:curved DNA-binding protein CbpA